MFRVNMLPFILILYGFSGASNGAMLGYSKDCPPVNWDATPTSTIRNVTISGIDESVTQHPYEERGFVSVPFDYAKPHGRHLQIFYRLMPASSEVDAQSLPILVVMNGGPGVPSSAYRALDHDYSRESTDDAFSNLSRHFRILAVDQRGTGNSSPLSLDDPSLSAAVIAKYFDSDEHAKDHARVIEAVIPDSEDFFILARSYGGHIGFQYLALGDAVRQPAGYVFSSSLLPHSDALETFMRRREKQKELNLALMSSHPHVVAKLSRLRTHFQTLGLDAKAVNYLWEYLGRGENWESALEKKAEEYLSINDRAQIEAELSTGIQQSVNLLNYVLSSSALTPGYTDRTIAEETSRRVPFEDWMLDEAWTLVQIGNDRTWREQFICSIDRNPPPPTEFRTKEAIRALFGTTQALFTFGASDAFLPQNYQITKAREFEVPEHTKYHIFSGGHGAAFSSEGAEVVSDWANKILINQGANKKYGSIPYRDLASAQQSLRIGAVLNSRSFVKTTTDELPVNNHLLYNLGKSDDFSNDNNTTLFTALREEPLHRISHERDVKFHFDHDDRPNATGAIAIVEVIGGKIRICGKIHIAEGAS